MPKRSAVAALAIAVLLGVAFLIFTSPPTAASRPPGVIFAVPITLTNTQPVATPRPFNQMLSVDSSAYANYEAPNLQNVEFFFANGNVIPSWLESGNTNTATQSIYWLKLWDGIRASSSVTIFMGFASTSANLFNGWTVGEAPQLSTTYAQYDNGRMVFPFYDNFRGPALAKAWTTNVPTSSYSVSDGLSMFPASGTPLYVATRATYSPGFTSDSYVTGLGDVDNIGFFNLAQSLGVGPGTYQGAFIRTACGNTYPDQWDNNGEANGCGGAYGFLLVGQEGVPGVYSVSLLPGTSSLQYFNYGVGSCGTGCQPVTVNGPGYPLSSGFVDGHGSPITVQWSRNRASPPNSVMPSAAFGVIWCPGQGFDGIDCPSS